MDAWLAGKPAYLRIYLDIPGQPGRVKHNEALGKFPTRKEARRKADKWILAKGVNNRERLAEALQPTEPTFRSQANWWLSELESGRLKCRHKSRRGRRVRTTTVDAYRTAIAYLNGEIGDKNLAGFDNAEMKELIYAMETAARGNGSPRFTPKTIVNYYLIAAAVFASAKDRKGKPIFPRQWDPDYIGLPAVNKKAQNTPTVEPEEIETILREAKVRYRVLYSLLAGSGLRIAEALGLEIGKHLSPDCSIIFVRQQRSKKGTGIEAFPKTDAGFRDVDLDPSLAQLLKNYIDGRKSGFLFQTTGSLPLFPRNIARDSLHPILKTMGRTSAGFHIFRRFREATLQMSEARTLLIDYWMGHANGEMSGRYGKQLLDNIRWRQECVAKVGLGFTLPENPLLDKLVEFGQVFEAEAAVAV
jgi:integrase